MLILRASLVLLALLGFAGPGPGLPPAAAAPQETPPAATPAPPDPLLEFVPKEHVPADSAVSFPVDI
ncbi:MAG TPA: hypothetical protein VIC87_01840 [Vicinamibacteria bacterium]|jgi:hypothetical protein